MSWNFDDNNKTEAQKQADFERNLKLAGTGGALSSLATPRGRKVAGAALNVLKGVTAAPLGAGYGLLQSAASVLRGKDTGGVFGEVFEKFRASTAPADVGGGSTPNISVKNNVTQGASKMNVLEKTSNLTKGTTVYNTDLGKKAAETIGKANTTVTGLPGKEKIATQIAKDTAKHTGQTVLKFPKVGMLDLVGAFAPFIKMATNEKKRKGFY